MNKLRPIALRDIHLNDRVFNHYIDRLHTAIIPYQWEVLNDRAASGAKSGCLRNLRIAAGLETGEYCGMIFQDSDLAKWLEAVAYSLQTRPDADLEARADACVALLEKAQHEDGYLNSYFTIEEPDRRWTNLMEGHELYCAGHFIEAAVAYYEATGKRAFMDVMCRYADLIDSVFGPEPEKRKGYPGHEEIELALVKLYRATGNARYLRLAAYFVEQRGQRPLYFEQELAARGGKTHFDGNLMSDGYYAQTHLPPREQSTAEGHAVRAMYLYCAMADLAEENGDAGLRDACRRLFKNVASEKMYITGGIGSAEYGERFTAGFDLPNDTCYCETCASIGLALFALRMSRLERDASYADVMERALYNTVLAGVNREGNRFFYVNPLEIIPDFCDRSTSLGHVKAERQEWFDVACCPTNIARTLGSLGQYVLSLAQGEVFVNLYLPFEAALPEGGTLALETRYPNDGGVKLMLTSEKPTRLYLRIPAPSPLRSLTVNGRRTEPEIEKGYALVSCEPGETAVALTLDVSPRFVYADPRVSANAGKAALTQGPLVYCFEQADNGTGLAAMGIDARELPTAGENPVDPAVSALCVRGWRERPGAEGLYTCSAPIREACVLKAVPYYCWNNRGRGEMRVWMRIC